MTEKRATSRCSFSEKRSYWRVQCRNRLSIHIEETLELHVDPSNIRLRPDVHALYAWQLDNPKIESLFRKPLSKHSVGALKELSSEAGKGFRAVHRSQAGRAPRSFEARLRTLEDKRIQLETSTRAIREQGQSLVAENMLLEWQLKDAAKQATEMEQEVAALERQVIERQKEVTELAFLKELIGGNLHSVF
ncbi:uncharacterized protein BDV17DRAFT_265628 [Aspergillus undulatus]|uniref:uncharacterized protein n=1 Tax=Aspergillus undulatus TaxID=1810928 RepID=UPI003CCCF3EE